jgi:hypothetical protein
MSVALAANIWGENGITLFAAKKKMLAYRIDNDWALQEKLILCIPLSDVSRHTLTARAESCGFILSLS